VLKTYKSFIIFLILLLTGGSGYTQDSIEDKNQEIIKQLEAKGLTKEKLAQMMKEVEKHNPQEKENFEALRNGELSPEEAQELMKRSFSNLPPETQAKVMGASGMDPKKIAASMDKGLEVFRSLSYEEAHSHIKKKMDSSKLAGVLSKIPKSSEFVTNFLRDKEAPKKFFGILGDRKRLLTFAGCSLFIMVVSWLIKKKRKNQDLPFGEAMTKGIFHFLFFTGLKLALVGFFFHPEITPLIRIFKETYS
tara:strand:+ start:138609 stop:139355 length:747 start_codon:yes stop_codon:yes gene_type:complete